MEQYREDGIRYQYFKWLVELVEGDNYILLLHRLSKITFSWFVDNDENRAADGIALRGMFMDENDIDTDIWVMDPCTIFEMLVGLAVRMNDLMIGIEEENKTHYWFWLLMDNLDLGDLDDDAFFKHGGLSKIDDILDVFINRKYDKNGVGGLFPLMNSMEDQREVEIWYQMSIYLDENYSLDEGEGC